MRLQGLMIIASLLIAGGVQAQQPAPTTAARPDVRPVVQPNETSEAKREKTVLSEHHCLRYTGSRITTARHERRSRGKTQSAAPDCAISSGRVWTRDDLQRTGASNVLDALRMLDPSVY